MFQFFKFNICPINIKSSLRVKCNKITLIFFFEGVLNLPNSISSQKIFITINPLIAMVMIKHNYFCI